MREVPNVAHLGEGVWSLPIPIPDNPLGYTLVYVLATPHGPVLVDAGWDHEESWQALTAGLDSIGANVGDVQGVVLTHFHPDHSGLAERIRATSGAWVAAHRADADLIRRVTALSGAEQSELELAQLRRAGASSTEVEEYAQLEPRIDPPPLPDHELSHGDALDISGRKLRVIWTPGHAPGHICLHLEDSGLLFLGDHVLPRITPHIGLFPFDDEHDPLGSFLESLEQIGTIDAWALPAHEQPFTDLAARTTEIIEHHEERLSLLSAALSPRPAALWELVVNLPWRKGWENMHTFARRMAASETAAHMRTLERRERALRETGPDGVVRWTSP